MALLRSNITSEVGLRLLLCPIGSNIVMRTACCTVGIGLPVYSTFKAIERKDQNEQQKWLIYWAAYGSFSLVEVFADKLVSWLPMYYHLKFAFLVWLQLPTIDGAKQLYQNHLRPFFLRHQAKADQVLGFAYGEMVKLISKHQAEIQLTRTIIMKMTGSADQMLRGIGEPDEPDQPQGQNQMLRGNGEPDQPQQGHNAIEAPTRNSDTESDHDD